MKILTEEDIDKLFNVTKETTLPPVTIMKPSEIEELDGYNRLDYKIQFHKSLRIYVKPLEKLVNKMLDNSNKEKYTYDVTELSVFERVKLYNNILIRSGYTKEQIASLLPNTEEDVDTLAKAFENGFKELNIMDNKSRVLEAKKFLKGLNQNILNIKK